LLLTPCCEAAQMERKIHLVTREVASADESKVAMLAEQGKVEDSLSNCERCLKEKPNDPHLKLLKAQMMRFLLEDSEAEKILKELQNADLSFQELKAAASTAEALDQWELTKQFAEKGLSKFPKHDSASLLLTLGHAQSGLGNFDQAEKTYLKAVNLDSGNSALEAIIYFFKGRKKPEMVVKFCSLALARNKDPNSLTVVRHHKFRAGSLMQLSKNKEALADLNYCVEKTPSDSYVFRMRADVNEKLGDKKNAELDRKKAIEIDKSLVDWK